MDLTSITRGRLDAGTAHTVRRAARVRCHGFEPKTPGLLAVAAGRAPSSAVARGLHSDRRHGARRP
jgi:hypothetical protein